MKKKTITILIATILMGILSPVFFSYAAPCNNADPTKATNHPCGQEPSATPSTPTQTSFPSCTRAATNIKDGWGFENGKSCKDNFYYLLAPLPCVEGSSEGCENGKLISFYPTSDANGKNTSLGKYLNMMIKILIGICAVLAMGMIILGGLEYMTNELVSSKESGKQKITGALLGLVLALGSWALLNTINPALLNSDVKIKSVTVEVNLQDLGGENLNTPFVAIDKKILKSRGIDCNGNGGKANVASIGQQFIGKSTYSMPARNTVNSSTIFTDCSSFAAQVYNCVGLPSPGSTTSAMFSGGANTRAVKGSEYDFNQLNAGDLIGWKAGDNGSGKQIEGNGHVMIYLGGGKVLHSSSTAGGVTISNLSSYKDRVTYVKWP